MAEVTKEQLLEFIRNNDLDWDESYPHSDWWKFRDERDAYKKQRDELINQLIKQVEQWSIDKGLDKGNSFVQFSKQVEETGEVAAALCRDNTDALRDGIGDVVVTLVILAQQNNMTLQECLEQAYGEIKDRKGVMSKDGSFIKEADLKE